ncbi:transcription elongation factor [Serpentinimonas raichei]|uniref:Transcription elongation factor GreB n=1 Tax=Serpentinimonas raichei TaxID=1458425 RepID=A0A060NGZ6_9BURK|nr:transcription elongation factor GreB [Serpentinimonas raichei]BAO81121.1 transcription elongation factor [Serpentinimonas raichei]
MSKAFTKETDHDDDDDATAGAAPLPAGGKNYITPAGHARLRAELLHLLDVERPRVVEVVHWAASNGDRSENGDYLYGKKRLREIDRRIRFLGKRLEIAVVVDPALQHGSEQVFFGASVVFARADGSQTCVTILGIDEAEPSLGQISWVAPVAQALLKARVGDEVRLRTPAGWELLEVIEVSYPAAGAAGAAPAPPPACA